MALAVRRLLLRKACSTSHKHIPLNRSLQWSHSRPSEQFRSFHPNPRWRRDDDGFTSDVASKSSSESKIQASRQQNPVPISEDDFRQSVSPSVLKRLQAEMEMEKSLGRPLNDMEKDSLWDDHLQQLLDTGNYDELLDEMKDAPPEEQEGLKALLKSYPTVSKHLQHYKELADVAEAASEDPEAFDEALERLNLTADDMDEAGRVPDHVMEALAEMGVDTENEQDFERQIWEQIQRLDGMTDEQIQKARHEEELEDQIADMDPHLASVYQQAIGRGPEALPRPVGHADHDQHERLTSIMSDDGLFKKIDRQSSLNELWYRLGWSEPQHFNRLEFIRFVQLLNPWKRSIIMKAWERDEKAEEKFQSLDHLNSENDKLSRPRDKQGFWTYGEENDDLGPDEDFQQDDLPRKGHQELDLQREIREFGRMMVWELPLLNKLAKPFVPPTEDQVLRFRYTTYMGEQHPAERKVVVEFDPQRLGLSDGELTKLIKLAGPRFNPSTSVIKMSCESFETAAQNKRYLGDLVDMLIKEAKDTSDTFADMPLDFRHHKPKVFHHFPEEWKMTQKRREVLLDDLARQKAAETLRIQQGLEVDGKMFVPMGPESRRAEQLRSLQVERERVLKSGVWPEGRKVTEEERTVLREQRQSRMMAERLEIAADKKSRRPSKRDRYTAMRMAEVKGLGIGRETRPSGQQALGQGP